MWTSCRIFNSILKRLVHNRASPDGYFAGCTTDHIAAPAPLSLGCQVCRNPEPAKLRAHKCEELFAATEQSLAKIKARVDTGKIAGADTIGLTIGKVISQYKVAKHFQLDICATSFTFQRKHDSIAAEAALDGIYIIRTSMPPAEMDALDCVRSYKALVIVARPTPAPMRRPSKSSPRSTRSSNVRSM